MKEKKRILIAPLDWGLGHASRCVPIIESLSDNFHLYIAASGRALAFLQHRFPKLDFIELPGYDISYPDSGSMALKMALQTPRVLKRIQDEHRELKKLVTKLDLDMVISDNRFGMYSNDIPSIYITHQVHIQAPGIVKGGLHLLHKNYIDRYDQCWIPDYAGEQNLAGDLSHGKKPENAIFIGHLSRFQRPTFADKIFDYCALLSGPEPQRTAFEKKLIKAFKGKPESIIILQGKPDQPSRTMEDNITLVNHATDSQILKIIGASEAVISRPGYSSLMDLAMLGSDCIFVPTPGQTEQEYLGKLHSKRNGIPYLAQSKVNYESITKAKAAPIQFEAGKQSDYVRLVRKWI